MKIYLPLLFSLLSLLSVYEPLSAAVVSNSLITGIPDGLPSQSGQTGALVTNGSTASWSSDAFSLTNLNAVRLQGYSVSSATPSSGNVLVWNTSSNSWFPSDPSVLSNVNAVRLQGSAVSSVAPSSGNVLMWNTSTNNWLPTAQAASTISSLSGATATNTIDNAGFAQTWTFNTLTNTNALTLSTTNTSLTTGALLALTQTPNGAGVANSMLKVTASGAGSSVTGIEINNSAGSGGNVAYGIKSVSTGNNTGSAGYFSNASGTSFATAITAITAGASGTRKTIDVTNAGNDDSSFGVLSTMTGTGAVFGVAGAISNSTNSGATGVFGQITSTSGTGQALYGYNNGTGGYGVRSAAGGTGIRKNMLLEDIQAAANDQGPQLVFSANRTTTGQTQMAGIAGSLTDSSQSNYLGALEFFTANSATMAETMRLTGPGYLGVGTTAPSAHLTVAGNLTGAPAATGAQFRSAAYSFTDNATAASGTAASFAGNSLGTVTLIGANANVTTTDAVGFSLNGAPVAGANETLTTSTAVKINSALAVNGGGTVGTAIGLRVLAPTGATNNYAAYFSGGAIGIDTATPQAALDVASTGTLLSAIIFPRDTTANRPTGVNGMIRYNTTLAAFEGYQNGNWITIGTSVGASVSGTYNVLPNDSKLLVDSSAGVSNLNLPNPASVAWKSFYVVDQLGNFNVNNVNLMRFGSEKINGIGANRALSVQWGFYHLFTNGVDWWVN